MDGSFGIDRGVSDSVGGSFGSNRFVSDSLGVSFGIVSVVPCNSSELEFPSWIKTLHGVKGIISSEK